MLPRRQSIDRLRCRCRQAEAQAALAVTRLSHDPSFPSDHATAAFAIAVAVLFFHRRVGAALLVAAAAIALSRVLIAMHYPTDVIAGALTGTAAAIAVCKLGGPLVVYVTGLIARLTDPLLRTIWRAGAGVVRH
ncbi:MAG TPA: phosphatase PAP2 family protein [Gaiellaceae bacterium]|nr:phosphatase PAP2 family protein [Gaiellaceae bacterium]